MSTFNSVDPIGKYLLGGRMANALVDQLNTDPAGMQEKNKAQGISGANAYARNTTNAAQAFSRILGIKCLTTEATAAGATATTSGYWGPMPLVYDVEVYSAATHGDRFLILSDPLPASDKVVARAYTSGTCKVKIDIKDVAHKHAIFKATQPTASTENPIPAQLESAASGTFRIVSQPDGTGEKWCTAQFPAVVGYGGMFAVVPSGTGIKVIDGAATSTSAPAGYALINGVQHSIASATFEAQDGFIYLLATDPDTAPTLAKDASMPTYEEGKCKILIARVIGGRIVQEHHGMIYGIIWGDCES